MQRLEVSGAVRPIYGSLGVTRLITNFSNTKLQVREYTAKALGFVSWERGMAAIL